MIVRILFKESGGMGSCCFLLAISPDYHTLEFSGKMDDDLLAMTREELLSEVKRLREGIRRHRDVTGHDLCWYHPELWGLLPDASHPSPHVPSWSEFMEGCVAYRRSLEGVGSSHEEDRQNTQIS